MQKAHIHRRAFLKGLSAGVVGTTLGSAFLQGPQLLGNPLTLPAPAGAANVGLVKGGDRRRNMREALQAIEKEVREGIGDRQVVIKPNFVSTRRQLSSTHVEGIMGILDFLKPFYKKPVIITESPAGGPAQRGYEAYGYTKLTKDYNVILQEMDKEEHKTFWLVDRKLQPAPVRMARTVWDKNYYTISAAVMKTHNAVVATLGLKNLLVGAALKIDRISDKRQFHHGTKLINYNLFVLSKSIRPDLTTIDGFVGMQGNGPTGGFPMESGIAIASTDVIAADRVGVECMGINFADVGYLNYCVDAGVGQGDLNKIKIVGSDIKSCVKKYEMAKSFEGQLNWKSDDFQTISLEGDVRS
jgi:uncharacterized protein (DUF362 family)